MKRIKILWVAILVISVVSGCATQETKVEKEVRLLSKEQVWHDEMDLPMFNHAATCVKNKNGDMLVAWFAGAAEGEEDVGIWLCRKINGEWKKPEEILQEQGLPHWNPVLHQDGDRILLYYKVGPNCSDWYTKVAESYDFGETWSEPREAIEGDHTSRIVTKNKLLVTTDGRWLAGCSTENETEWDCQIEISTDKGKTWTSHSIPIKHWTGEEKNDTIVPGLEADGVIQPALWQSDENTFHCLMRSSRGYIYRSDSYDGGETWCEAYPTDLPNNNSGITLVQQDDGTLVLIYNPSQTKERTPLSVAISQDNGKTWTKKIDIETQEGAYSYPYAITDGKTIDVVYTWNNWYIAHCEIEIISE